VITPTLVASQQAAQVLNQICSKDELRAILQNRNIGLYGRLRKAEMARVVAGDEPAEVLACDQVRQKNYRTQRKELSESTRSS
jgi:hypothetical protein